MNKRELCWVRMLYGWRNEKSEKSLLSSLDGFNGLMNNVSGAGVWAEMKASPEDSNPSSEGRKSSGD